MDDQELTVRRWLQRAEHDFATAETMLAQPDAPTDVVCFHCQQCVEKSLKAWLVKTNCDFPKTHDLQRLLSLCISIDDSFRELQECAPSTCGSFRRPAWVRPTPKATGLRGRRRQTMFLVGADFTESS